ncbi:aminoglycoside phosphotransferase family protein [Balneatrix alpica]|uniref:aminoglycoside phosphotransferase family protein n=1 Tax=Balneatrix alpica TaxID=75684 RepID=UPI00273A5156|nr:phosphotransferase [Balneatrix alpica]
MTGLASVVDKQGREWALQRWVKQQLGLQQEHTGGWPAGWHWSVASADASFRRYFRLSTDGGRSWIAADAPPATENNQAFVALAQHWRDSKLPVPEVLGWDYQQGFLLLEDLGDCDLASQIQPQNAVQQYQRALQLLPLLAVQSDPLAYPLPQYDAKMLAFELGIFQEWVLERELCWPPGEWLQTYQQAQDYLIDAALSQPQVCVHRDFHSRNLMLDPQGQLRLIDIQGAVRGPLAYDAVSLLRDCYLRWPVTLVQSLRQEAEALYRQAGVLTSEHSSADFERWFDLIGVQRHLKAVGLFIRLARRDGKPGYLDAIPRTLSYVVEQCQRYAGLHALGAMLQQQVIPALQHSGMFSCEAQKDWIL